MAVPPQILPFLLDPNETIVSINITDDDMLESNEKFFAIISEVIMIDEMMMSIANQSVTVTIEDNDGME